MKQIDWTSQGGVVLLNALHNCRPKNVTDQFKTAFARGVLVGIVSGLMFAGYGFDEAWEQIVRKVDVSDRCVPDGWPTKEDYVVRKNGELWFYGVR